MKLDKFISENGKTIRKVEGDYLFRQGERTKLLYLLRNGLLKAYYLSSDGKEHIKSFILPGGNIGSLISSYAEEASTFSVVCLKQSELIAVEFDALYNASKSDIEISSAIMTFLLGFGMKKEIREFELLCLSAEERYRRLLKKTPEIFELVTQNEIARYIGITPVGLSRIKKRLES